VTTATVLELARGRTNFGYCYSNVAGLTPGEPVRVLTERGRPIYCTVSWYTEIIFSEPDQVALDAWQCAALGAGQGDPVSVVPLPADDLPPADFADLRLISAPGESNPYGGGLTSFLLSNRYLLYAGLRFCYQPPGDTAALEYEVVSVLADGQPVPVARPQAGLALYVRPGRRAAGWVPGYHHIGGLQPVIDVLRRDIELPLRKADEVASLGIRTPDGILLYGPHGTGKTTLARAVGQHSGAQVAFLSGAELASRPHADCEEALRSAFGGDGRGDAPCLIIIDDIDFIAPNRNVPGASTHLLGLLLRQLDEPGRPAVLATTTRRDAIDPAVQRLGRIGQQVAVPAPGEQERRAILEVQTRWLPLSATAEERGELLTGLARRTAGFVGADLEALCRQAGSLALRRTFPDEVLESNEPEERAPLEIQDSDWERALTLITPSAVNVDVSEVPLTTFDDVVGQPRTVAALRERLILPLRHPEVFAQAGLSVERGVLLYGPPGTGKTLLARAVAHECDRRFMAVRGSELLSKWFGESEQAVRDLFDRARALAPCVVFFDEIDAIARRRSGGEHDGGTSDRVVNQLLAEIDGFLDLGQVTVIGATNNRQSMDPALLRPGRLGLQIEVPLPDAGGRRALFRKYLPENVHEHCADFGDRSAGMSGADIAMVGRESRLNALRRVGFEKAAPVAAEDVVDALEARRRGLANER
jgi:transitional endoplasmic reticulum ATPase